MSTRSLTLAALFIVSCSSKEESRPPQPDTGTGPADTMVTGPVDIQVDTYNVALAAAGVDVEAERRPVLLRELGKLAGDFLCVQEAWRESDKLAIRDAMKNAYPHSAWIKTNRATKIDDPTDKDGKTPPPPAAPCVGTEATDLDTGLSCLAEKCSTVPGSADGFVKSTQCAKDECLAAGATLLAAANKTCYACFASNLATEKIKDIASVCKTPGYGLGFGGEASVMVLSKHPLSEVEHKVVPGCWQQRVITRATATLPNGAKVDFYCNHLSPVIDDTFIPYTCPWGGGATSDKEEWENEQLLQAQKLAAWAATRKGRSVILGDINATPLTPPYGLKTLEVLNKTHVDANAPGFTPRCTFCKANVLTHNADDSWLDHIMIGGLDKAGVKSTVVTFDQAIVDTPMYTSPKVAMSDHYGLRVVLTVPQ